MIGSRLSPKAALGIFVFLVVFILAQAVWWIVFMAQLTDEKVEIAEELGADSTYIESLHRQEVGRQIMIGLEGVVFLLLLLLGVWLIYRALARSEELKRHEQNFLMAVTHELKTPLASLRVYLDTLGSAKIAEDKKQAVVPRMRQDLGRLERMVEDILEAGRFDRASFQLQREPLNLTALIEEAVRERREQPSERPVGWEVTLQPGVTVLADARALRRAVDALLDNAVKYSSADDAHVGVTLDTRRDRAVVTVADRGMGLERRDLRLVFDRFYRVGHELTRTRAGSGLGLYLCREMIKLHGGEVTARSLGPGHGSEFEISLPLHARP